MNDIDKLARALRLAYAEHEGDAATLISWTRADHDKKEAWRAIAQAAMRELGCGEPA